MSVMERGGADGVSAFFNNRDAKMVVAQKRGYVTNQLGKAGYPKKHGAHLLSAGVVFNLWATSAASVELLEEGKAPKLIMRSLTASTSI